MECDNLTQTGHFKIQRERCSKGMSKALFKQMLTSKGFEYVEQDFHFGINYAVRTADGECSVCYTDTENRAELIEYALNTTGDLIEENAVLRSALKRCFDMDCGCVDCRAVTGKVNHGYCDYHRGIVKALEE